MGIKAKLIQVLSLNVVLWLLMLTAFTGLLFCTAGVYMLLAARIGEVAAALITGGSLFALVALLLLFALLLERSGKRSKAMKIRDNPDNLLEHQMRPVVGDQVTDWAKRHTGIAVVGALSAGVLLASSPGLRSTLLRATGPILTRKAVQTLQQFSDNS